MPLAVVSKILTISKFPSRCGERSWDWSWAWFRAYTWLAKTGRALFWSIVSWEARIQDREMNMDREPGYIVVPVVSAECLAVTVRSGGVESVAQAYLGRAWAGHEIRFVNFWRLDRDHMLGMDWLGLSGRVDAGGRDRIGEVLGGMMLDIGGKWVFWILFVCLRQR